MSRDTIRKRARDLERNADHVEAMITSLERNVVGSGLRLRVKINKEDEITYTKLEKQIETLWESWCSPENCDITGRQCFSEMETMAVRRMQIDGGIFFIATYTGCPETPLQLQMKEVDELYTSLQAYGSHKVVGGIELNDYGKAVAYHFADYDTFGQTGKSIRVKASRAIYLNQLKRPSQVRELSGIANIISRLRDLNQYIEAVSVKEMVLSCLSVFIKKVHPTGGIAGRTSKLSGDTRDKTSGLKEKKLVPAMIQELEAGDDISVVNPSGQASNAKDMISILTRSAFSAAGLSYEAVSRDMSQVNYSSARQNLLEDRETYQQWQHYLSEHLCRIVYRWFLESCVLAGTVKIPDFFSDKEKYMGCTFIARGISWIDPVREVTANKIALETFQTTLEEVAAEQGKDWREVMRQRAKEQKYAKELSLQGGDEAFGNTGKSKYSGDKLPKDS